MRVPFADRLVAPDKSDGNWMEKIERFCWTRRGEDGGLHGRVGLCIEQIYLGWHLFHLLHVLRQREPKKKKSKENPDRGHTPTPHIFTGKIIHSIEFTK